MTLMVRLALWSFPLLIMLVDHSSASAQRRGYPYPYSAGGFGVGVGVGYGPGYGPYWGPGWGYPAIGWMPNYYLGNWGNGLSMYGPPVPTHKPVPGMFGGGDSRFFGLPPYYGTAWMYAARIPLSRPAPLPATLEGQPSDVLLQPPQELLPAPQPAAAPVEIEVRVPTEDTIVYIDGAATKSNGLVRRFNSPPIEAAATYTYEFRAEWKVDGRTQTHSRRVNVKPGERVVVTLGE